MNRIAFNTANLVGRVTGYRFELKNWGDQHRETVAATDEAAWRKICAEIAAAGYRAVEIWAAHADPSRMTPETLRTWKKILADTGLSPIGYAGGYSPESLRVCEGLGITAINGGMWGGPGIPEIEKLARQSGVRYNFENHPEKSADEILQKIQGGSDVIGVTVDTGWFGVHGTDGVAMIRELGPLVRHTHIKDVAAVGGHATCALGEGVAGVAEVIAELKRAGYAGWYSWEDEPEDRNPLDIAAQSRAYIEHQLAR